jgi:NAD(P)-dependent dehydrogenase (short-subunit alcohol dehydrogenase family)
VATPFQTVLIVGASRGLGLGLAGEFAARGARVIATHRGGSAPAALGALAAGSTGRVRLESVDTNRPAEVAALAGRLAGERLDLLFVNAGISLGHDDAIPGVEAEAFATLMLTNALAPLKCIEALADLVPTDGVIAAMSSGLGSVASNGSGGMEAYRASKAALNTLLRSFAVRRGEGRTVLAVHPGWVRTDMGGPNATLSVEESVRGMADAITARRGRPGSAFIDYQGHDLAW